MNPKTKIILNVRDLRRFIHGKGEDFQVESMVNTTTVEIMQYLSANEVDKLIRNGWTINIK